MQQIEQAARVLGVLRSHASRDIVGDELERVARRLRDHGEGAIDAYDDSGADVPTLEELVDEILAASGVP